MVILVIDKEGEALMADFFAKIDTHHAPQSRGGELARSFLQ
jgi:hypothetical protein